MAAHPLILRSSIEVPASLMLCRRQGTELKAIRSGEEEYMSNTRIVRESLQCLRSGLRLRLYRAWSVVMIWPLIRYLRVCCGRVCPQILEGLP